MMSPRWPGGSQPSVTANSKISRMPSQKFGTARPRLMLEEMIQSAKERCRVAATTPSGRAMRMVRISPATASSMVAGARWPMSCATGSLLKIDLPRSPWTMCPSQTAY